MISFPARKKVPARKLVPATKSGQDARFSNFGGWHHFPLMAPFPTDAKRAADEDNPEGYWEWDAIKKLPKDPRLIEQAEGKAVKVISALLPSLPGKHRYTVIYMVRPTEQVVDSQWAMLARQGTQPKSEKKHLVEVQEHHSRQIREVLRKSERVTLLEVSFPELVADPEPVIAKLAELLPGRFTPGPAVAACVKPQLFRNRGG